MGLMTLLRLLMFCCGDHCSGAFFTSCNLSSWSFRTTCLKAFVLSSTCITRERLWWTGPCDVEIGDEFVDVSLNFWGKKKKNCFDERKQARKKKNLRKSLISESELFNWVNCDGAVREKKKWTNATFFSFLFQTFYCFPFFFFDVAS